MADEKSLCDDCETREDFRFIDENGNSCLESKCWNRGGRCVQNIIVTECSMYKKGKKEEK